MPAGKPDRDMAKALRDLSQKLGWSAAKLARELKIERTLVWRAMNDKPVTEANLARLRIGLGRLSVVASSPRDVAYASNLLRFLLRAVEAFEAGHAVRTRRET
jgi:transcriptional regulator with XRE-family HTH domain